MKATGARNATQQNLKLSQATISSKFADSKLGNEVLFLVIPGFLYLQVTCMRRLLCPWAHSGRVNGTRGPQARETIHRWKDRSVSFVDKEKDDFEQTRLRLDTSQKLQVGQEDPSDVRTAVATEHGLAPGTDHDQDPSIEDPYGTE